MDTLPTIRLVKRMSFWIIFLTGVLFLVWVTSNWFAFSSLTVKELFFGGLFVLYGLLSVQAGTFLYWAMYAWSDPDHIERYKSPKILSTPHLSFTALLPARHEQSVIADTIRAIAAIDYPEALKELLVLIRKDDLETLEMAETVARGYAHVRVVVVDDLPVNKPNQLNWGLDQANNEIVVVFDAEDQPHPHIYNLINTVMQKQSADVVQAGVQLINHTSKWFSVLNCLEYYFWFKSILPWFATKGVTPLGGNTVFFKRNWLLLAHGWDENCLTEDGEVGLRLSKMGAKTAVVYDEAYATLEETPVDVAAFIKQRTRWNQGFLQILSRGLWRQFGSWNQRLLAGYLLILPLILSFVLLLSPVLTVVGIVYRLPILLTMFSFVPVYILGLFVALLLFGSIQFARAYRLQYPWWMPIRILVSLLPYQIALALSSVRAIVRFVRQTNSWEKTAHINAHRTYASSV